MTSHVRSSRGPLRGRGTAIWSTAGAPRAAELPSESWRCFVSAGSSSARRNCASRITRPVVASSAITHRFALSAATSVSSKGASPARGELAPLSSSPES